MNLTNLAAIADDRVTTVNASYDKDTKLGRTYTFKIPKTLAHECKVGDFLLADSAKGLGVVQIHEIHDKAQIDPAVEYEYKWAFQRVAIGRLEVLKKREEKAVLKMKGPNND